ncbi:MAG TPA: metal-dependent hydrolase [Blastocatellia bacterium]|nr:metal-dependent hydrolase [Blastocatellia bacterium]
MDNITHSLVGLALAETGLKRTTPLATTTLVIAANLPDIDIVTGLAGQLFYLEHHRGVTHSLVAIPILSLLLAAGVFVYSRRRSLGARFGPLCGLSLLATMTHPLLDYLNSYGWRPFQPWSDQWYYGDIAFVIDPWIWVVVGGALFIFTAKTWPGMMVWAALFITMAAAMFFFGDVSLWISLPWLLLTMCAVVLKFSFDFSGSQARFVITGLLVALLGYFGTLALLHRAALGRAGELAVAANARDGGRQAQAAAMPTPANPFIWRVVLATDKAFYISDLNLTRDLPALDSMSPYPRETGDPSTIAAARQTAQAQTFLRFARFPTSEVITSDQNGAPAEVEIRDVRFQNLGVTNTFRTRIRLDKNLRPIVE